MRRPPGGEARGIEIARAQWLQCGGGGGGRGERAGGGPAGQPAEQADEAERVGDGAVAVGHRVERRVGPVQRVGGTGEGLRQAARTAPDRGECGAGGEAGRAQRQIERVDPGVGVGEPAGGLGGGHAGAQAVAHRVGAAAARASSRASASVASHSGTSRPASASPDSQHVRVGRQCLADRGPGAPGAAAVGVGFVWGVLPGRAEQVRIVVDIAERAFSRHPCASPSHWYRWASMTDRRRFGRDGFVDFGGFRRPGQTRSRTRETGEKVPSDNPALRTENRRSSLPAMTNSPDARSRWR